jgi:hypothetical protein
MVTGEIKIVSIEDQEDGSAKVQLDCSPETYQQIFEYGFTQLILKGLEVDTQDSE